MWRGARVPTRENRTRAAVHSSRATREFRGLRCQIAMFLRQNASRPWLRLPPGLGRGRAVATVLCASIAVTLCLTASPTVGALSARAPHAAPSGYVLIYNGPAVCDGCAAAIGHAVVVAGFPARYVARAGSVAGLLPGARLFVVPGTNDNIEPMRRTFDRVIGAPLRAWLLGGGRYLGLCGGAFLGVQRYWLTATQTVPALGIVPATADTYADNENARLEKVRWFGQVRWMYYQGGPYFMLNGAHAGVTVDATYADGSIAALSYRYGRGTVLVSGVHPEATIAWLTWDGLNPRGWEPTFPLAVAMIRKLLS